MLKNIEIQKNNYFEYRKIDSLSEGNKNLPLWIKSEILNKETRILDYGCGFGNILKALQSEGYQNIYGVDIEKNALKVCRESALCVEELNLSDLKNPYSFTFDIIILSHIIEHIPKENIINNLLLIKENFLSEKGKFLIAVPNAQANTDSYWAYEDWTHTTLFTSGSIYYVLKAVGFENIEFLDIDCTLDTNSIMKKIVRKSFLRLYIINKVFWNKVTGSGYHKSSPNIYSYEIKVTAY